MHHQLKLICLAGLLCVAGQAMGQETKVSFDAVTGEATDAVPDNGSPCAADGSDICADSLSFLGGTVIIDANTAADSSGTDKIVWFDKRPTNRGGLGAASALNSPSSDDSAIGQTDWMTIDFPGDVSLSGLWVNGDHAALTNNTIDLVIDSATYSIVCAANGTCDLSMDAATNPLDAADRTGSYFAVSAASGVKFYLAGIAYEPAACIVDETTGFCSLATELQLDGQQWPLGGIVQQLLPDVLLDPRVDSSGTPGSNPNYGRCTETCLPSEGCVYRSSSVRQDWKVRSSPDIWIPWWMCGSPYVALVDTITNFDVEFGVVDHTLLTGLPAGNDPSYICEIPPIGGDLQKQSVFGWIPDNPSDVIEGQVLELTNACTNPAKGKSRSLSILLAGLHIDWGRNSATEQVAINDDYQWLLIFKSGNLRTATQVARPFTVGNQNRKDLRNLARVIETKIKQGACKSASSKLRQYISKVEGITFNDPNFNHEGELLARAENILFTLEAKFCPFTN